MFTSRLSSLALPLALLLAAACAQQVVAQEPAVPERVQAEVDRVEALLVARDVAGIVALWRPDQVTDDLGSQLEAVLGHLPEGAPVDESRVGWRSFTTPGEGEATITDHTLTNQYAYADGWAVVAISLREDADDLSLIGLHVAEIPEDLRVTNAFTLEDKPPASYLFLFVTVAVPIFIAVTFCFVFATKDGWGRKALWGLFVAFGVTQWSLNWTTGEIAFSALHAMLLGADYARGGEHAPWIFTVSVPIGAIAFWMRQSARRSEAGEA